MILKKYSKYILIMSLIFGIVGVFLCTGFVKAADRPVIKIGNIASCSQGDSISFTVDIVGNNIINGGTIPFNENYVILHGFSANVSVRSNGIINGNRRYTVSLNNVRGNASGNFVQIKSGAAVVSDGRSTNYSLATNSNSFNIKVNDTTAPNVSLIGPNVSSVANGGTVTYIVRYTDESGVTNVNLYKNSVKLNGFTANISITGGGENSKVVERKITLSNIQGTNGSKYISIVAASATDYSGNKTIGVNSSLFNLVNQTINNSGVNVQNTTGNEENDKNNVSEEEKNPEEENTNENKDEKPEDWVPNPKTGKY